MTQDHQLSSSKQHTNTHLPSSSTLAPSIIAVLEGRLDRTAFGSTTQSMTCEAASHDTTSSCDNVTETPSVMHASSEMEEVISNITTLKTSITCSKEQDVCDSDGSATGDKALVSESSLSYVTEEMELVDNGKEEGKLNITRERQENVTKKSKNSGKIETESASLTDVQQKR